MIREGYGVSKLGAMRMPPKRPKRKPEPVTVEQVMPVVMREALRLAKGDASKIHILATNRVEVITK